MWGINWFFEYLLTPIAKNKITSLITNKITALKSGSWVQLTIAFIFVEKKVMAVSKSNAIYR